MKFPRGPYPFDTISSVSKPKVTLVTCAALPNLEDDEAGLLDALSERGLDPQIAIWDDPDVDWANSGMTVVRSVRDYAKRREEFIEWSRKVPRLLNHRDVIEWNTDKHYLLELERRGLPTVPTVWLEPSDNLSKHQVHCRFPAHGDFVVKPAISSGGRGTGRYTAIDAMSRMEAISHAYRMLKKGKTVMVQRYLDQIDHRGEVSLVYLNGLASYSVEKAPMLHPSFRSDKTMKEEIVDSGYASDDEWRWGERIRRALHSYIRDRIGRDEQLLFNRVDIVRDDAGGFYVLELSLIDGSLYLSADPSHLEMFADAIAMRAHW